MSFEGSIPLLIVSCVGAFLIVTAYAVFIFKRVHRVILSAGASRVASVAAAAGQLVSAASLVFCMWFIQTRVAGNAVSILGLGWTGGGELLVCIGYAAIFSLSALRVPVTVWSARVKWIPPLIVLLVSIGASAVLMAVVALTSDSFAVRPSVVTLTLYRIAAVNTAVYTLIGDALFWTCQFRSFLRQPRSSLYDSILPTDGKHAAAGQSRRMSLNDIHTTTSCWKSKRCLDMKIGPDWWAVWIGSSNLAIITIATAFGASQQFIPAESSSVVLWERNPLDSFAGAAIFVVGDFRGARLLWGVVSLSIVLAVMLIAVFLSVVSIKSSAREALKVLPAFCAVFLLAVVARLLGAQSTIRPYGLSATLWALMIGLLTVNLLKRPYVHDATKLSVPHCCFYYVLVWLTPLGVWRGADFPSSSLF